MATTLQHRRGTSAEANAFTGAEGEFFVDLENKQLILHDGITQGGLEKLVNTTNLADGLATKIGTAELSAGLAPKQDNLVSGTNIKTINGESLLGSSDITVVAAETITSIALNGNSLDYTNENGTTTNIDLSAYLDDTQNTVASAAIVGDTITFTRQDATTFTLDIGSIDANKVSLVTSTDNAIVKFDGVTGEVQDTGIFIDDTNNISGVNNITAGGTVTVTGDISAVNGTLTGDLGAVGGTFTGDISAVNGTLTGDLGAANVNATADIQATGSVSGASIVLPNAIQSTGTAAIGVTDATVLTTFDALTTKTGKLFVEMKDTITGEVELVELLVIFDGTTASIYEGQILYSGVAALSVFSTSFNGGNDTLEVISTQATANATNYKIVKIAIV